MLDVLHIEQGTPEWHAARLGVPTASRLGDIMAKGRAGKGHGKARHSYMCQLAAERITGEVTEIPYTAAMERGHQMEPEARRAYEFITEREVSEIGFVKRGGFGASPDGLVGTDGGLEIKSKAPHLLVDLIHRNATEPQHVAQCEGCMFATGRQWWDLLYFWPGMPIHIVRVERDDYRMAEIEVAVREFGADLDAMVEAVMRHDR